MGSQPIRTAYRSLWQNGIAERWVGSIRRELLDHVIVLNRRHLRRLLNEYIRYYHEDRTHLGPAGNDRIAALLEPTVERMLVGGIALAGANRPTIPDDGIVSPLELAGLDLRGTTLVFISGCSTAEGTVRNAEGIYGIRRGLELAGSRAQILTLWEVDVTATNDFVIDFYKHWFGERKPAETALHDAQAGFRNRTDRKDPFYSAAFVLSGGLNH